MEPGKTTKYSEKLARYILIAAAVVILALICRTFSKVLIYIAAAGVVSLIAQPLMALLRKIRIKGKCAPDWLLAIVSILLILLILSGLIAGLSPVVKELVKDISEAASGTSMDGVSENLAIFNAFLRDSFNHACSYSDNNRRSLLRCRCGCVPWRSIQRGCYSYVCIRRRCGRRNGLERQSVFVHCCLYVKGRWRRLCGRCGL